MDERLCWGTLGETGSSRLQVAWKYGLPLGADITVTTSPMVAVKWRLIAMLPEGMLWATPFICRPQVLQVEVRPNELNFSRLSGVLAASMPVQEGSINWLQVQEFLMQTLNVKSEFHFKLLVENRVVGPRNLKTLVHLPLLDEDTVPMPAPVPLTPVENWSLRQAAKAPRRYREEFLHHELKSSDEESDEATQGQPAAAGSAAADADGCAAAAPTSSSSTTDSDATLLLGDTPPSRRVTKKRTLHNMD